MLITKLTTPRRVYVRGIDAGDGKRFDGWLIFSKVGVAVKRYGTRKAQFAIPLQRLASLIAVRSQVDQANRELSMPERLDGDHGPLFKGVEDER